MENMSRNRSPMLSIIIPTYNEKGNMPLIIPRIAEVLGKVDIPHEIIVMDDDSPDGTASAVEELSSEFPQARCVVRKSDRGLSPSVIQGFGEARGDIYLVMDADLSHPVDVLPLMYRSIVEGGSDVVVGSRHTKEGGIENWPFLRRFISWGAALMARPLTSCSDPMSGFFALKPGVIKGAPLRAKGYKILLEILVKGRYERISEVPITFKNREIGESKLGSKVMINYLQHLLTLYLYPGSASLVKFLFVGGTGMLVDLGMVSLLLLFLGDNRFDLFSFKDIRFFYLFQAVSFIYAVTWNFVWNRYWTFDARSGSSSGQYVRFFLVAIFAFLVRSILLFLAVDLMGFDHQPLYEIALVGVIMIVTIINYLGSKLWAFSK
ncbi:MAG: glycosyltransferase family 2 protein [Candidatus Thermoplasmatota archaeon]|nr:glycosyltransferase family 2 protein [Candidatus Thermoplasmatota archaeon]